MKHFKNSLSILLMSVVLLTGCSTNNLPTADTENIASSNNANQNLASSQVLNVSLGAEPDSLDVAKVSDSYSAEIVLQTNETLTRLELNENGETVIVPGAAESWDVSEDGLEWTFYLRDALWCDGEKLTAHDYEYGMKRILNPSTMSPIARFLFPLKNGSAIIQGEADIETAGVEAIDEKTLIITLEEPLPYFLHLTTGRAMVPQRQDIVEKYGDAYGSSADKTVSSGIFKVEEWTHNSNVKLVKNENYWDAESVILEEINMKIISETMALMGELMNGGVHMAGVGNPEWMDRLDAQGNFKKITGDLPRTFYIFMNQEIPLFSNAKVRQALSASLDRDEIANIIFDGMYEPAYGWVAPPVSVGTSSDNFRNQSGNVIQSLVESTPDPKALFIEGLKELGMDEDPSLITIELMVPTTGSYAFAEYLQQVYNEKLGIQIQLDTCEWPVFQERNRQLDYQMGFKSWGGGHNDPTSFMDLWLTDNHIVPIGWSNESYDQLVVEAATELDPEKRLNMFIEAEKILLVDDCAVIPYIYAQQNTYINDKVQGIMQPDFGFNIFKYAYILE